MNANLHPRFAAILDEYIAPATLARIGARCEVLVAVNRSDPIWIAGTVEHVDASHADDVRLDIRADDGRLLAACRADFCVAIVNDGEAT